MNEHEAFKFVEQELDISKNVSSFDEATGVHVLLMVDPDDKADFSFEQEDGVVGFDGDEGYVIFHTGTSLDDKEYWIFCQLTSNEPRPLNFVTSSNGGDEILVSSDIASDVTGSWESEALQWFPYGPFALAGDSIRIHTDGNWPHVKQFVLLPSSVDSSHRDGDDNDDDETNDADIMDVLRKPTTMSDNVVVKDDMIVVDGSEGYYEFEFTNQVWASNVFLDITYASGDARPLALLLNGNPVEPDCCAEATGSYSADDLIHVRYGPYPVEAEVNTIKITTNDDGFFPHIGQIRVVNGNTEIESVSKPVF